jgi:branched-subunit amino acid aminotransferase/4-amino-4-deoxychorismate lyase
MIVFLNGNVRSKEQALVSVFDRGFVYGDGIFEAVLAVNGKPFRWTQHMERFERSAAALKLAIPFSRGRTHRSHR